MKAFQAVTVLLFTIATVACAYEDSDLDLREETADARLFFVNFTSSLVQVNATILAYGLIFLGIIAAAAIALYYLYLESQSGGGYGYGSSGGYGSNYNHYSNYARSAQSGYDFNAMNILSWISMMQDAYDNFDFNDLECQKRLICEVMREPEYFGTFAAKARTGFHWGGQLASMVSLPDDVRELVDEYLDASERSSDNKQCEEYFQCPYSIKNSIEKNILGSNAL